MRYSQGMPYLDWSQKKEISVQRLENSSFGTELSLGLTPDLMGELVPYLKQIFEKQERELRLELPLRSEEQWTVYFKLRDIENRALLAHPEPGQWVATLAFTDEFGSRWADALAQTRDQKQTVRLEDLTDLNTPSNLTVSISVHSE